MTWKREKVDGCTLLRSGEYEIWQCYEEGWQVGKAGQFICHCTSKRKAIDAATEHERFS